MEKPVTSAKNQWAFVDLENVPHLGVTRPFHRKVQSLLVAL